MTIRVDNENSLIIFDGWEVNVYNTLYTGPKPPSPILLARSKLLVAALICLKVKEPVCRSRRLRSVRSKIQTESAP